MGNLISYILNSSQNSNVTPANSANVTVSNDEHDFMLAKMQKEIAELKKREILRQRQARLLPPPPPIRVRGPIGPWVKVGIIYSKNPKDDTVLTLEARMIDRGRRLFNYRIRKPKGGIIIQYKKGKDVDELFDGQEITFPSLSKVGPFIVDLYE